MEPVLQPDTEEFEFRVLIRNTGADPAPAGELHLELRPQPLADPDELTSGFPDVGTPVTTAEVRETAPDSTQEISLRVPRDDLKLQSGQAGVYLLRASLEPGEDAAARTANPFALAPIIWEGAGTADPVALSTIVPLTLPSDVASMPTREQIDASTQRLMSMIDSAESLGSTLAIDPRIISGIRAYGTAASADAQELLDRLTRTSAPVFLLQFADADPAAQAALGLDELLTPLNFDFVTNHGEFSAQGTEQGSEQGAEQGSGEHSGQSTETPEPSSGIGPTEGSSEAETPGHPVPPEDSDADTDSDTVPSLSELLNWPEETPTAWPVAGSTDRQTLDLLKRNGIDSVIVDSGNVTRTGGPRVQLRSGQEEIASGVVVDRDLRLQAERALVGEHEIDRASGVGSIAAELVLAAQDGSPGLVLALDRGATTLPDLPSDASSNLLETIAELDWVDPVPIAEQRAGDASLRSASASAGGGSTDDAAATEAAEQRLEQLRAALDREPDVQAMSPLLEQPNELVGYQRARLMQLFATRYAGPNGRFSAVADRYAARDSELLEGVRVTRAESTHLVGTSTRVPVQVHNSLPFDALVTGEITPSSAALSVEERSIEPTLIPADGNQHILVPVLARVSSGESGLVVTLRDTVEGREFDSSTIPISISSSIETIALGTLVGLTTALLGFGVWRSVRRRRADRRGAPAVSRIGE